MSRSYGLYRIRLYKVDYTEISNIDVFFCRIYNYLFAVFEMNVDLEELNKKQLAFSHSYFLIDMYRDREKFYSLTAEDFKQYPYLLSGKYICLICEGRLDEANEMINSIPPENPLHLAFEVISPEITWKNFINDLAIIRKVFGILPNVIFTAGRPFLLNGFNDFTRIGPFLEKHREAFLNYINALYDSKITPIIYNLCLAEYYYQQDKLVDAEILVTKTVNEFENYGESRLLFVSLNLQTRIFRAEGIEIKSTSLISEIEKRVKKIGHVEFSYNLQAVDVVGALYEGNYIKMNKWLLEDAPDEYADFNMVDLYRYFVKLRCYLIKDNHVAIIALAEKLRPLLIRGKRHMDLCELNLLLAMSFYAMKNKEEALHYFDESIKITKCRKYYRLIEDEGERALVLLLEYIKVKGLTPFLKKLVERTRKIAKDYPLYLKKYYGIEENFTQLEKDILSFLEMGKTKEEIAERFFISVNTVKFHTNKIYNKLNASNAAEAVWIARKLGIIK